MNIRLKAAKIRGMIIKAADDALSRIRYEDVEKDVTNHIQKNYALAIKDRAGIDVSWNNIKIRDRSILNSKVTEAAARMVESLDFSDQVRLTNKELADLKRAFHTEYMDKLKYAVRDAAREYAHRDTAAVSAILISEAVNEEEEVNENEAGR